MSVPEKKRPTTLKGRIVVANEMPFSQNFTSLSLSDHHHVTASPKSNGSSEHIVNLSHSEFVWLVLSSNLEKNMSHMTGAGSSAGAAAASAAAIAATTANAVVPMQ